MRQSVEASKRAVTKPISLYPEQVKHLIKRCNLTGMSHSKYFQRLLEYDKENNLIGTMLAEDARRAA